VKINKLEQLRKYIFDRKIERIKLEQGKKKIVGITKTISIQSVFGGINPLFICMILSEKFKKNGMLLPFF